MKIVRYGFKNNIDSLTRLKRDKYRELHKKYSQLPSCYIHTVCQDASTRIKNFNKFRKKGLTKLEKSGIS